MTVVAIPSQKALLMCPYISSGNFSVLAPRCSRAHLHNLQLTSDRCLIFASHLPTGIVPHLYASMQAAQTPASKLRFVTPHNESSMNTLWQEEEYEQICKRESLTEKAIEIEKRSL